MAVIMTKTNKFEDIFADWKNNPFVVYTVEESELQLDDHYTHVIILTDIGFWAENMDKLDLWCQENHCNRTGMMVAVPGEAVITAFIITWRN
jgi:hypothetical protein